MKTVLEVSDLSVIRTEKNQDRILLNQIHFSLKEGQCLGILGESGSGKSMTAKAILGLLSSPFQVSGSAIFQGRNLIGASKESLRNLRGKEISMVLQNPMTCFDPLYSIGAQINETFLAHTSWTIDERKHHSLLLLDTMKIQQPKEVLEKYPHQLSGGMLQRIMIGLAMSLKPALLIADEPTTAIDAITQYSIMKEFQAIKEKHGTSMIFISHDLGAISCVADQVLVLNNGNIGDYGSFRQVLRHPKSSYTQLLIEKRQMVMERYRNTLTRKQNGGIHCA